MRGAYFALPGLVEKWRVIVDAHGRAIGVGQRTVKYDHDGLFSAFENPMTFFPGWKLPAPIPRIPFPDDATARLLWLASDEVTKAKPWLSTMAEQDAAWWAQFGQQVQQTRQNHHNARAMAAQAMGVERRDGTGTAIPAPPSSVERQAAYAGRIFGTEDQ